MIPVEIINPNYTIISKGQAIIKWIQTSNESL